MKAHRFWSFAYVLLRVTESATTLFSWNGQGAKYIPEFRKGAVGYVDEASRLNGNAVR